MFTKTMSNCTVSTTVNKFSNPMGLSVKGFSKSFVDSVPSYSYMGNQAISSNCLVASTEQEDFLS